MDALLINGSSFDPPFLQGGGEMGTLIRKFNWLETELGHPLNWSPVLKTSVNILLNSRFPMFLFWGENLNCFYNDSYRPSLGIQGKHPGILGLPAKEAWKESWKDINPLIQEVLNGHQANWKEDQLIPIYRNGAMELAYWTFSYSPVHDEYGQPCAIFVTCMETTEKVLAGQAIVEKTLEMAQINRKLSESNEMFNLINQEVKSKNQELTQINQELLQTKENLEKSLQAVFETEARFRSMIHDSPIAMLVNRGEDLVFEEINDSMLRMIGKDISVKGKKILDVLPELEGQPILKTLYKTFQTGETIQKLEEPIWINREGKKYQGYFNLTYSPLRENGIVTGILQSAVDVTEMVLARKKIEQVEAFTRLSIQSANLGTYQFDMENAELIVSDRTRIILGFHAEDFITFDNVWSQVSEKYKKEVRDAISKTISTRERFILDFSIQGFRDKKMKWVRAYGGIYQDQKGQFSQFYGVIQDITESITINQKFKESQENLQLMADNVSQLIWMADETGHRIWFNKRWEEYTGADVKTLSGYGYSKLYHPDYSERVLEKWKMHVQTGEIWEDTYPLLGKDGEYKWFLSRAIPLKNAQGKVLRWFGTNTDITREREILQEKDDFISIASHELKTPVTSLWASLQLLDEIKEEPFTPLIPKLISYATQSGKKITQLIEDLLDTSRLNEGQILLKKSNFDIMRVLEQCCIDFQISSDFFLTYKGLRSLEVYADETRIEQVIVNFLNNVKKYAANTQQAYIHLEKEGKFAKISIEDLGPGIDEEKVPNLFHKYYRTESSGARFSGLGLGLYINAEIIKKHGGKIGVESKKGKGSKFWFTLPLAEPILN